MKKRAPPTQPGYYWVKDMFSKRWRIAHFSDGYWTVTGNDMAWPTATFLKCKYLGPQVELPRGVKKI